MPLRIHKLCLYCILHLVQGLENTGHCETTLQSSVSGFLQGAQLSAFSPKNSIQEHSSCIIVSSTDTPYVYKSRHTNTCIQFLLSDLPLSSYPACFYKVKSLNRQHSVDSTHCLFKLAVNDCDCD